MPSSRVLALALDAAEPTLLRRWSASGELPVLRRLLQSGSAGRLETPSQQFPDMSFFSAYTGLGAASLGRYFFIQPRPGTARLEMLGHRLPAGEPFWVTAARHGRRCVAIDTPKLGLHPPADGIHLTGWGMHGSSPPLASHPAAVAPAVLARFGAHPVDNCDDHGRGAAGYRRLLRQLLEGIETRRLLLLDLMRTTRWDLFFAAFAETHCVGHQFWHFLAAADRSSDNGGADLATAVRDVYAAVDRAIGDLVEAAGAETRVVLFSSQGMRPQYHGRDLVPTLLRLWGMRDGANRPPDPRRERRIVSQQPLMKRLREAVPLPLQYVAKRRMPERLAAELVCRFVGMVRLDAEARAFQVPNNEMTPALRINVAGRDPHGRVAPGREQRLLGEFLAERLRQLVNPATGAPALAAVDLIDDVCRGEHRDVLPDVTGYWSPAAAIDALYSPGYGTVVGAHRDHRSGGHAPEGFLWMSHGCADGADIRDIAPTVLNLLGVPVPQPSEGRSLA